MPEMLITTHKVQPLPTVACETLTLESKHMDILNKQDTKIARQGNVSKFAKQKPIRQVSLAMLS